MTRRADFGLWARGLPPEVVAQATADNEAEFNPRRRCFGWRTHEAPRDRKTYHEHPVSYSAQVQTARLDSFPRLG